MRRRAIDGIVTFADGLPGFEEARQFVILGSEDLAPFTLVQGVGDGAPAFVAIEPRWVDSQYAEALAPSDMARLGAQPGQPLLWLALVSAHEDGPATVNLRAPLVINPAPMIGIQLVNADRPYPLDHPLPDA